MPEAATIPLPPMPAAAPQRSAGDTPASTPEPGRTPMSAVFDRALNDGMMAPTAEPPPPAAPAPAPAATPPTEPPVKEVPPAAEPTDFVPPEILTAGDTPATTPTPELSVADQMPEDPGPAIRTKEGQEKYKKWRGHQLKLETENKGLREQLKTQAPADQNVLAENQLLKQRLVEMSSVVERADLLSHPAFQEQFVKPHKAAIEAATLLVKEAEIDPALLNRALNATGKDRRAAIDELNDKIESPTTRMELVDLMVKINGLEQQRDAAMTDIKGSREQLEVQDRAQRHRAAQEQAEQMGQLLDSVIDSLANKHGVEMYRKTGGKNAEWDAKVDRRIEAARDLAVNSTNYEQMVAAVALGMAAPEYRLWALSEQKRRVAAETELAEIKGATPGLNGTGGGAGAPGPTEERTGIAAIFDRAKEGGTFGT